MEINYLDLIDAKILFLTAFIYSVGLFLKSYKKIRDDLIPVLLWCISIVVAISFYLISSSGGYSDSIFNGVIQGTMVAAFSVFGNQLYKQYKK